MVGSPPPIIIKSPFKIPDSMFPFVRSSVSYVKFGDRYIRPAAVVKSFMLEAGMKSLFSL